MFFCNHRLGTNLPYAVWNGKLKQYVLGCGAHLMCHKPVVAGREDRLTVAAGRLNLTGEFDELREQGGFEAFLP